MVPPARLHARHAPGQPELHDPDPHADGERAADDLWFGVYAFLGVAVRAFVDGDGCEFFFFCHTDGYREAIERESECRRWGHER